MRSFSWLLVAALLLAHHDFWYWNDPRLVFGFLPLGLWFHVLISIGAAVAWALVVRFAWPSHLEAWADQSDPDSADPGSGHH
ncbi:MAG: DUF3311 domain-containing protein [Planctomycetes bacterium]|nr:DUF3311 domain-containing protein [Planctomycetota bacterium]